MERVLSRGSSDSHELYSTVAAIVSFTRALSVEVFFAEQQAAKSDPSGVSSDGECLKRIRVTGVGTTYLYVPFSVSVVFTSKSVKGARRGYLGTFSFRFKWELQWECTIFSDITLFRGCKGSKVGGRSPLASKLLWVF